MPKLIEIRCIGQWEEINPENDNVDVHAWLDDGRKFSFLVATPNNIYSCMANEGVDYYFGTPPIFVQSLTKDQIDKAIRAILVEQGGRWLQVYGTLQVDG